MGRRTKLIAAGGAAGFVLVVFAIWFFVFRDTAPDAVSLAGALDAASTTTTTAGAPTTSAPPTTVGAANDDASDLDGTWAVDTDRGDGVVENSSFVGYRVQEELASIGTTTAVGRTTAISGTFTFSGSTLTTGNITADMTQLMSDSRGRDGQMRTQALETNTFPEASFVVTEPVDLGTAPQPGEPFQAEVTGDLTIHGVTQSVTVPIEGQLTDDTIVVIGSIEVLFEDYEIARPRAAIVLSVEDRGIMEFQLFLKKA